MNEFVATDFQENIVKIMKVVNFSQNLSSDLLNEHFDLDFDLNLNFEDENDEIDEINNSVTINKNIILISDLLNIHTSMLSTSEKMSEFNAESYSKSHFQSHFESYSESYFSHFYSNKISTSDSHAQLYTELNTAEFKKSSQ